jgi:hypothetical protein
LRSDFGQIDEAPVNVWSAIGDRHHHEVAVSEMRDARTGAERQGLMRRGWLARVEDCSAGGSASGFFGAIPRGNSDLRFRLCIASR